jgi:DNA adenine methylase
MGEMIKQSNYFSPLRYPGGKNCIFSFASQLFYDNDLIGISYAEPYAGGAGLALRLLFEEYVSDIYINDLDKSIYLFWEAILNRPDEFCEWIKSVKINVTNWRKYKEIQSGSDNFFDSFEIAKSTFFLNRTNVSGVIKGGIIGGINQTGKYKIDARFNKIDLINRIKRIATLKHRIHLSNLDGLSFINKIDKKSEEIFIYLDPPYFQKGADLYMNFYKENDHERLSKHVEKLKNRWMVSYDNHEFILNLYSNNNKILYKLSQGASNRVGDEILVFSQFLKYKNAIMNLQSPLLLK